MATWNNKECKKLIEARYGPDAAEAAAIAIHSVNWKFFLAEYHAGESRRVLEAVADTPKEATKQILVAASGSEEAHPFLEAAFESEAHIIACAAAVHSLGDILSQVVFVATGLSHIPEHLRGLNRMIKELEKLSTASPVFDQLQALQDSDAFKFIQAYVNTTKHRSLLPARPFVHFAPGPEKHGLKVMGFSYKGHQYPETWFDTICDEYRRSIEDSVNRTGVTLSLWLRDQAG